MAKSFLSSHGIESFIKDEHIVSMNWLYSNVVGGVKLMVKEQDFEKAQKLLADVDAQEFSLNDNLVQGIPCTQCTSTQTEIINEPGRKYSLLGILGLGTFLPLPFLNYEEWKCHSCSHIWKVQKPVNLFYLFIKWILLLSIVAGTYLYVKQYLSPSE